MGQKIDRFFGVAVDVKDEIELAMFERVKKALTTHLAKSGSAVPADAEVHVMHLVIRWDDTHFKVTGLQNRVSHLGVKICITKRAKDAGKLSLVDLGCRLDNAIEPNRNGGDINYIIPVDYVLHHQQYCDYVAVIIRSGCPPKHRRLQIRAAAHATSSYATQLKNVRGGYAVTVIDFYLSPNTQLRMW
jgi:hypothetical protein